MRQILNKGLKLLLVMFIALTPFYSMMGNHVNAHAATANVKADSDVPPTPENVENLKDVFEPGNGNASIDDDGKSINLAQDFYQAGSIFGNYKLDLTKDFTLSSYLYFGNYDAEKAFADGITFTMHNDSRGTKALGDNGEGLGAYSWTGSYIQNALSFEYDSYYNSKDTGSGAYRYDQDLNQTLYGHTAIVTPADIPKDQAQPHEAVSYINDQIADGTWKKLSIHWDKANNKLTYTFNGVSNSKVIDPQKAFKSNEVYWGFTGSTGATSGAHDFLIAINQLPQMHNVTADYVDKKTGEKIHDPYAKHVKEGGAYSIPKEDIADYTFDSSSDSLTGTMGQVDRHVTLYYNKKENHKLVAHYVDKATGKQIKTDYTADVKEGDAYNVPKAAITGYTFDSSSESLTGAMGASDKEITVYYNKDIAKHKLTAHYVDKATGKQIKTDYTADVKEGDKYNVPKETIADYTYNSSSESLTGTMGTSDKEITLYYDRQLKGTITADDFVIAEDTTVTGTFTGDVHTIKIYIDGKYQGMKVVTSSPYSLYVGQKILKLDQDVEVVAYDVNGKELDRAKVNIVKAQGVLYPNSYKVGTDSYIDGTYTGNIAKVRVIIDGKDLTTVPVKEGKLHYYARPNITSIDQDVEMVAYSKNGVELDRKKVKLVAGAGTVNPADFKVGSSHITGTATGDVKKVSIIVDGKEYSKAGVTADGKFSYYVTDKGIKADSKVVAVGYSQNGEELDRKPVNIINLSGTVKAYDFKVGDAYIKGTATGDVTNVKIVVDGKNYTSPAMIAQDGSFQYYVTDKGIKAGSKVEVIGYSKNGTELDRKQVKINGATGTIKADTFKVGSYYITGTATGDVTRVTVKVDNKDYAALAVVNADGTFKYFVNDKNIKADSKVEMIGKNSSGAVITSTIVKVVK